MKLQKQKTFAFAILVCVVWLPIADRPRNKSGDDRQVTRSVRLAPAKKSIKYP